MAAPDRLTPFLWPEEQAAEALRALALESGVPLSTARPAAALPRTPGTELDAWLDSVAAHLGVEISGMSASLRALPAVVADGGPVLLRLPGRGLLLLLDSGPLSAVLLTPELRRRKLGRAALLHELFRVGAAPHRPAVAALLERAALPPTARQRIEERLLRERLQDQTLVSGWLLRDPATLPLRSQARRIGLVRGLARIAGAYLLEHACAVLALLLLGQGALSGRLDAGWLSMSLLLLLSMVALRLLAAAQEERLAVNGGAFLRERLLLGALRSESQEVRRDGIGRMLGRVLEAEALEWLFAGGGLGLLLSGAELLIAAGLLLATPGGGPVLGVLFLCGAGLLAAVRSHLRSYQRFTEARLALSAQLIESMIGHRTRVAQLPPALWHEDEDVALSDYRGVARALDRRTVLLLGLLPRGFLVLAFLAFLPTLLTMRAVTPAVALVTYAILLCGQSFAQLCSGLPRLAAAREAFRAVRPLLDAAAAEPTPPADLTPEARPAGGSSLCARSLLYTPSGRRQPVLQDCGLVINPGDRILLTGPSGTGKSTLAALLAGLVAPQAGLLLLDGRDPSTLGARAWRRRVALAPQYHENHILSASLCFNLLLGRAWPPSPADLAEAATLCEELGLGPLLSRMPGGMFQQMGETGWQLSQGERSRVFLARALLQGADVLLLDESLGALDPQTLTRVAACLSRRAPALVLIAHP